MRKNSKIERTLKCKQSFSLSEMCFFRRSLTDGFGSIGKISFTFSGLERLLTAFEHERMNFLVWPHCNPRNSFGALSESGEETLDEVTETLENKVRNYWLVFVFPSNCRGWQLNSLKSLCFHELFWNSIINEYFSVKLSRLEAKH